MPSDWELVFDYMREDNLFICWIQVERSISQGISYVMKRKPDETMIIKKSELQKMESVMEEGEAYQNSI